MVCPARCMRLNAYLPFRFPRGHRLRGVPNAPLVHRGSNLVAQVLIAQLEELARTEHAQNTPLSGLL